MCLILLAYQIHPEYPLVVAANRDEFLHRGTLPAQWWSEAPQLLAGKDLEADGTWMGVSLSGRFAAITNVREPHVTTPAPCSRGLLPRRYLEEEIDDQHFASLLYQTKYQYLGYNLLFGNSKRLYYYSNRLDRLDTLAPGIYGLSNAQLDTPWPKIETGKQLLSEQLTATELKTEKILEILTSTEIVSDDRLPATGVSIEWERKLSAIRITGSDYGTRSSTALIIARDNRVDFHERTLLPSEADFVASFQLQQ